MKKISAVLLSFLLLMPLSSCKQAQNTVQNVPLTSGEQRIADLTSDMTYKFSFPKGGIYDIKIYLYRNGTLEVVGAMSGFDTEGNAGTVLISGRKDGNVSYAWGLSDGASTARCPATEIDDDTSYIGASGIGQDHFTMEAGKEYALAFAAYVAGPELQASATEPFNNWDTLNDKAGALSAFTYAYVVTAQLSDA